MDPQTIINYLKQLVGNNALMKTVFMILAALAVLSIAAFQLLPFLIFLLLAIIAYLQLSK